MAEDKLSVLVVEDDAVIAQLIQVDLEDLGHEVIDVAHSGLKALEMLSQHSPDLVLLDVDLADTMDGIDVGRVIQEQYEIPFIYLTAFSDGKTLDRARKTEPCGYIVKPYKPADLATSISIGLFNYNNRTRQKQLSLDRVNELTSDALSQREFEIVKDVTKGLTNAQIAHNQNLSLNTVKWHLQNVYSKMSVKNRTSLVQMVLEISS